MQELRNVLQAALAGADPAEVEEYLTVLRENGYESTKLAAKFLTLSELREMGVTKTGHAKAIREALLHAYRQGVQTKHMFYISHDKADAGTEASMIADAAFRHFPDRPAFIDSDYRHFLSHEEFVEAMHASQFVLFLLTPGFLTNLQCLAELVWAHRSRANIYVVLIERTGLDVLDVHSISPDDCVSWLSRDDWVKLSSMEVTAPDVASAVASLQGVANPFFFVFRPHESREVRSAFFGVLWRFIAEVTVAETEARVFAVNQRVDARWRRGDRWYTGRVTEIAPNGTYSILYDDGDRESGVHPQYMQPYQSPPVTYYSQDERIEARWRRRNAYFPGRIVAKHAGTDTYDIVYDDGDIEYRVSYELVRRMGPL